MQRCGVPEGLHSGAANENMNKELIVNVNPTRNSHRLVRRQGAGRIFEGTMPDGFRRGDIYLGKVRKIMPGLNAAFVNIGHEKDAFIHYLRFGDAVPVVAEAGQLAAARQTGLARRDYETGGADRQERQTRPTSSGGADCHGADCQRGHFDQRSAPDRRHFVGRSQCGVGALFVEGVSLAENPFIGGKTPTETDCVIHLPKNFGVIIRTAAMEASDAEVEHDMRTQLDRWRKTVQAIRKIRRPRS